VAPLDTGQANTNASINTKSRPTIDAQPKQASYVQVAVQDTTARSSHLCYSCSYPFTFTAGPDAGPSVQVVNRGAEWRALDLRPRFGVVRLENA